MSDRRVRGGERELAINPGDPGAWARLSRDFERKGDRTSAVHYALRGYREHPTDTGLTARLAELRCEAPWPMWRGNAARTQCSPLPGPDEGVQRWRHESLRDPVRLEMIGRDGAALVSLVPNGLLRVAGDGSEASLVWPNARQGLRWEGGLAVAFDPALGDVTGLLDGREVWPSVRDDEGRLYAWTTNGQGEFVAVDPDGVRLWARRLGAIDLVTCGHGVLCAFLGTIADPVDNSTLAVVLLDPESGDVLRTLHQVPLISTSSGAPVLPYESLAIAPDGSVIVARADVLFRFDVERGLAWSRAGCSGGPVAVDADQVVTATPLGVMSVDLRSGDLRWRREDLRTSAHVVLDVRGNAYVAGYGWFAGVRSDGELMFKLNLPHNGQPGPIAIGYDNTAFFTVGNELIAVR